jgi:biotin synthase-related radical SAM superfamily protein
VADPFRFGITSTITLQHLLYPHFCRLLPPTAIAVQQSKRLLSGISLCCNDVTLQQARQQRFAKLAVEFAKLAVEFAKLTVERTVLDTELTGLLRVLASAR